jgi:hypothetical protein
MQSIFNTFHKPSNGNEIVRFIGHSLHFIFKIYKRSHAFRVMYIATKQKQKGINNIYSLLPALS